MRTYSHRLTVVAGNRRRRGTAAIEFTLALLLLTVIVVGLLVFGWAMKHKHEVAVASRFGVWRDVQAGGALGDIHKKCLAPAAWVDVEGNRVTNDTISELIDQASAMGSGSADLANRLFQHQFPHGKAVRVDAKFNSSLAEKFEKLAGVGRMKDRSSREGVCWKRGDVYCWWTLCEAYYLEMDQSLEGMGDPADDMARMIRKLYLARW